MRFWIRSVSTLLAAVAVILFAPAIQADSHQGGGDTGPYLRGAFALGFTSVDFVDPDTQFGISGAAGYQFSRVFSSDLEFTWTGGGDVPGTAAEYSAWALVLNGRLYPLAAIGSKRQSAVKPYLVAGIGAGSSKLDPPDVSTAAFVFNIGVGTDIMLSDRLGLYGEVAHKVHAGDGKLVNGITNLNFGVLYRF